MTFALNVDRHAAAAGTNPSQHRNPLKALWAQPRFIRVFRIEGSPNTQVSGPGRKPAPKFCFFDKTEAQTHSSRKSQKPLFHRRLPISNGPVRVPPVFRLVIWSTMALVILFFETERSGPL